MRYAVVFLTLAVMLSAIPGIGYGEHVISSKENPQYLFVLSAKSGSFEGNTLTLKDVPLVIYFSDRPNRIAGHMSLKKFVEMWGKGSDSFKADPPNATLSIFDESGNKNVVVELSALRLKDGEVTVTARILQGVAAGAFGPAALYVDMYGRDTLPDL